MNGATAYITWMGLEPMTIHRIVQGRCVSEQSVVQFTISPFEARHQAGTSER
jgi:hypothetical protein